MRAERAAYDEGRRDGIKRMEFPSAIAAELAPAGSLRVGVNYGNPVLVKRDPRSGELSGVAVDLARELCRRAGLPCDLVAFESAGKMFDALRTGAWDVAFLAIDPGRAREIIFTPPYLEIEGTYLVPPASRLRDVSQVDRDDLCVAVSAGSAYDLFLSRSLKHARLVRAADPDGAFQLILQGRVDLVAGVRQHLEANAGRLPGARVLPGRFMAIQQALGIARGRAAAAKVLYDFIEDAKASGFVARAIDRAGVQGVTVAPPAAPSGANR